jgi:hypothetical protein
MRRAICVVALVATLAAAPAAGAMTFHDAGGLHVLSAQTLDSRLLALSVSTPALASPANVRILLPSGYAAHPPAATP